MVTLEMKVAWERKGRKRMICQMSVSKCPSFWLSCQQTFQSVGTWQFGCFPFLLLPGHNRSQYYLREWSKSCFMAPIKSSLKIFRTQWCRTKLDSWVLQNTFIQALLGQTVKQLFIRIESFDSWLSWISGFDLLLFWRYLNWMSWIISSLNLMNNENKIRLFLVSSFFSS